MPGRTKSSKKTKKLSRVPARRVAAIVFVVVFAATVGIYTLRRGDALGQVCARTSSSCAPTALECGALKPKLTIGMPRNGCVAALQAFYHKAFGLTFVQIDGIYGPTTRNVTGLYEGTEIASNKLRFPDGNDVSSETWHKIVIDCYYSGRANPGCATHYTYR